MTQLSRLNVEGIALSMLGENLVGSFDAVQAYADLGVSFIEKDGEVLGYREGTYYAVSADMQPFRVGSSCAKGDIHYVPASKAEYIENLSIHHPMLMPCGEDNIVTASGIRKFIPGRGEWVAETEGDALEMAVAFSREMRQLSLSRAIAYNSGHSSILPVYRASRVDDAVHHLPKKISLVYEHGLVITDRAGAETLNQYGIKDGNEICIRYKASKKIGRYWAVRGELDSYFTSKQNVVQVSQPLTLTLPADYPVFVG
jgi:hypothetical protein